MSRAFGLHTFCCLSKKRPRQVCDLPGQATGRNHGDETLPNGGLREKRTVGCSSSLPLETVVVWLYSSGLWASYRLIGALRLLF